MSNRSVVGDYCRAHKDEILGCSGKGRPTCRAGECLYGAEPCPNPDCRGFKAEGDGVRCNWCGKTAQEIK